MGACGARIAEDAGHRFTGAMARVGVMISWVVWAVQCSTVLASALALSIVMTSVADLAMDAGVLSARDLQESRSWSLR